MKTKYIVHIALLILLGLIAYWLIIVRCKRDQVVCPDDRIVFSHRCPENLYQEFIKNTSIVVGFEILDDSGKPRIKLDSTVLSTNNELVGEKYNQYTIRLFQTLRNAAFSLNDDPCSDTKADKVAFVREKIIEHTARVEELVNKISSSSNLDTIATVDPGKLVAEIEKEEILIDKDIKAGSNLLVAFYGYKMTESTFDEVNRILSHKYEILASTNLDFKPSWFSSSSAVMYYDDSNKAVASELARQLSSVTGKNFIAFQGAGLGVPEVDRIKSLRIHSY